MRCREFASFRIGWFILVLELIHDPQEDVEVVEEEFQQGGIEKLAFPFLHDFNGFFEREGLLVGTLGDQGIEDVRNHDDAAEDVDVGPGQTEGIAASVPFFMVLEGDNPAGRNDREFVGFGENGGADRCVCSHNLQFRVIQFSGLEEDTIRDPDLPHIVQRRRVPQNIAVFLRDPGEQGQGLGQLTDATDMHAGFHVAEFRGATQSE